MNIVLYIVGHWYTCKNNHVYTIGECGGAMQESKCPECGEIVGGGNHTLASGNRQATGFLRQIGKLQPQHTQPFQQGLEIPQHLIE